MRHVVQLCGWFASWHRALTHPTGYLSVRACQSASYWMESVNSHRVRVCIVWRHCRKTTEKHPGGTKRNEILLLLLFLLLLQRLIIKIKKITGGRVWVGLEQHHQGWFSYPVHTWQTLWYLVLRSSPALGKRPWTTRPWGDFRVSNQLPTGENPLGQRGNICKILKNRPEPESFLLWGDSLSTHLC